MDQIEAELKLYNSRMGTQIAILKDEQRQALLGLTEGDVLCVLPTGYHDIQFILSPLEFTR